MRAEGQTKRMGSMSVSEAEANKCGRPPRHSMIFPSLGRDANTPPSFYPPFVRLPISDRVEF